MNRRDFLVAGAVPLAAALGSGGALADTRRSPAGPGGRDARAQRIRIGIIGAGENVRSVMIPNFRSIPECELVAVANTSLASSRRVADEFGIPRAYSNWRELLDADGIDAIVIGTWPYMHRILTVEALDAGKHVLCQARMANNAREAHDMLEASRRRPDLVCQLVPTSTSYRIDNVIRTLLSEGYVGEVLSVDLRRLARSFADFGGDLHWRQNQEFSGLNTLNIGATYESLMRWLGRGNRITAMSKVHVPFRRGEGGAPTSVSIPDHVSVLFELANGAQVHLQASETTGLSQGNETWIYGSEGTIHVDSRQNVHAGRRGDSRLDEVPNPPEARAVNRVETEFVNAILGREPVRMATFEEGVHYMEWTEAVSRSAQTGSAVYLPLS
jgi:predicted dehydrogenase